MLYTLRNVNPHAGEKRITRAAASMQIEELYSEIGTYSQFFKVRHKSKSLLAVKLLIQMYPHGRQQSKSQVINKHHVLREIPMEQTK